jgi:uncharacterized protein (TIGR02246 family)
MGDEDQIRRTLAEYSHACDDGRFDDLADLFAPDARLSVLGNVASGRDAIRTSLAGAQPEGRRGVHITANTVVDVDGDSATAETDYLFVRATGVGAVEVVAAGRYRDTLVRHPDRWRFAVRAISILGVPDGGGGA